MRVLLATETCIWINQEQSKKARSLQFGDEAQSLVCSHHNAFDWFIVLTHAAAAVKESAGCPCTNLLYGIYVVRTWKTSINLTSLLLTTTKNV